MHFRSFETCFFQILPFDCCFDFFDTIRGYVRRTFVRALIKSGTLKSHFMEDFSAGAQKLMIWDIIFLDMEREMSFISRGVNTKLLNGQLMN